MKKGNGIMAMVVALVIMAAGNLWAQNARPDAALNGTWVMTGRMGGYEIESIMILNNGNFEEMTDQGGSWGITFSRGTYTAEGGIYTQETTGYMAEGRIAAQERMVARRWYNRDQLAELYKNSSLELGLSEKVSEEITVESINAIFSTISFKYEIVRNILTMIYDEGGENEQKVVYTKRQ